MTLLVGLSGANQAGKSSVAKYICEAFTSVRWSIPSSYGTEDVKHYSLADSLKEDCAKSYNREELGWNGLDWTGNKTIEGRQFLKDKAKAKRDADPEHYINIIKAKIEAEKPFIAIICDCRYINELNWIFNSGEVFYVHNYGKEKLYIEDLLKKVDGTLNESETEWRAWLHLNTNKYHTIVNNGDLKQLKYEIETNVFNKIRTSSYFWD